MTSAAPRRVGVIGFGKVGRFIFDAVQNNPRSKGLLEPAFVCEPFAPALLERDKSVPDALKTSDLDDLESFNADLVVEVAHPDVTRDHGPRLLRSADYCMASTTAFADKNTEMEMMREADAPTGRGIYCSVGALFGSLDIQKMSDNQNLHSLSITMVKHPDSFHPVEGTEEHARNERAKHAGRNSGPHELFRGSVRDIAGIFPVNVNTMCTAALAASRTLGMDGTEAILIADPGMETMIIEVEARGPPRPDGSPGLVIASRRENPSTRGEVTGPATLQSFYSSLLAAARQGGQNGIHLA